MYLYGLQQPCNHRQCPHWLLVLGVANITYISLGNFNIIGCICVRVLTFIYWITFYVLLLIEVLGMAGELQIKMQHDKF